MGQQPGRLVLATAPAQQYAKAGQHYAAASGQVTFAPLESRKTVEIALLPRSEFTETFEVVLEGVTGGAVVGSPVTVSILGKQPRFALRSPVQFLLNHSALVTILEPDYNFNSSMSIPKTTLEASEDLKQWTNITNKITRYVYASQQRLILDFNASMAPMRYYRLRQP